MTKARVLLADDHTLLLEAFQKLLADACDVVGVVSNGRDLVSAAASLRPDVIVVDIAMPLRTSPRKRFVREHPGTSSNDRPHRNY
jgi:DNA-binding NarL/FixJ family response regulator